LLQIAVGDQRAVRFDAQQKSSRAETTSMRPSGSQSTQHGKAGAARTTSLSPSRLTAMISGGPQSENQSRRSCQRGCSPNWTFVISISSSVTATAPQEENPAQSLRYRPRPTPNYHSGSIAPGRSARSVEKFEMARYGHEGSRADRAPSRFADCAT